jgi:hypothetical protein
MQCSSTTGTVPRQAKTQFSTAVQVATRLSAVSRVWRNIEIHQPIFFRSAQRFFIANDILLLPSGVRALPCFPFTFIGRIEATVAFFTVPDEFAPSSAAIARASLSFSCLSSATIFSVSKLYPSSGLVDLARSFPPSHQKRNGRRYILSIETGSEIGGEGLDQCLEQGFIVTFKSWVAWNIKVTRSENKTNFLFSMTDLL